MLVHTRRQEFGKLMKSRLDKKLLKLRLFSSRVGSLLQVGDRAYTRRV